MTLPLPTTVKDPATQQCLDRIAQQFPIQSRNLASGANIVASLPAKAQIGREVVFKADPANGVLWTLIYDGQGTYPWKKIGGPPLFKSGAGGANSTEVYSATGTASITTPALKMDALIDVGATSYNSTANAYSQTGLKVGAAAAEDFLTHHQPSTGAAQHGGEANSIRRELASGVTVQTEIRQIGGGTAQVFSVWLKIDPIQVG